MPKFVSLLRGINVSGQKRVPMAELKTLYEKLGFQNVKTYIQSGNVVFDTDREDNLPLLIETEIAKYFSFGVPVLVLLKEKMVKIVKQNPFLEDKNIAVDKLHVTLLDFVPDESDVLKISDIMSGEDRFHIIDDTVYLYCPNGYGRTKLTNTFFESKLKCRATTRNWKTIIELYRILTEPK